MLSGNTTPPRCSATTAADLQVADQEVFHDPAHPSTLTLPTRAQVAG